MLVPIVVTLLLLLIGFLVFVVMKPGDFCIERSVMMNASQASIFEQINSFHNFNKWNPFAMADPSAKLTYIGADSGVGAAYSWDSEGRSGKGGMQITKSLPASQIIMDLKFERPFKANNKVEFLIVPEAGLANVKWAMTGKRPFSQKLIGTILNMDKMVGGEFAKGLNSLKNIVEQ